MRFPGALFALSEKSSCVALKAEIICFNDIDQVF